MGTSLKVWEKKSKAYIFDNWNIHFVMPLEDILE